MQPETFSSSPLPATPVRQPAKKPLEPVFAFDLDGTLTTCEMLPCIARLAGLEEEVAELTRMTLRGDIPFAASFRRRFAMLRRLPLPLVHQAVAAVPLDPDIEAFIREHRSMCVLVTGNLDLWIYPITHRLDCRYFASRGMITAKGLRLLSVLDKGRAAALLAREGKRVIAIGESMNDVPLFNAATLGIAYAGVHRPVPEIRRLARHEAANGKELCELLTSLVQGVPHATPR